MKNQSIASRCIGYILLIVFWIILFVVAKFALLKSIEDSFVIPSVVCLCLCLMTVLFKLGFLEKTISSLQYSHKTSINKTKVNKKNNINDKKSIYYNKKQNWFSWTVLLVSILLYIILLIIGTKI